MLEWFLENSRQKNANKTKEINRMKQIFIAISEYEPKFYVYPAELLNLVKKGILEEEDYHQIVMNLSFTKEINRSRP
jgi:hypothetical protein